MEQALALLVVEDDRDCRETMVEVLQELKIPVAAVGNGKEAFDWITKNGDPRAILLDIIMPVMDGYTFAGQYNGKAPIILFTADMSVKHHLPKVFQTLSKPMSIDQLIGAIRRALAVSSTHQTHY